MPPRLHRCPECDVEALLTPEVKGAIHLDCPVCIYGAVFRDARGGYECSECDQRFLIHSQPPNGYGGPPEVTGGPLRWWERPASAWGIFALLVGFGFFLWLLPPWAWVLVFVLKCFWDDWRESR